MPKNVEKLNLFNFFVNIAKNNCEYGWEGLTVAKLGSHFTFYEVFRWSSSPNTVPAHRGSPEEIRNIPRNGQRSFTILESEPHMLEIYKGKKGNPNAGGDRESTQRALGPKMSY